MIRPILLLLILSFPVCAQTTQEQVREYRRANEHSILQLYTDLLRFPNVASDIQNIKLNAARIMDIMELYGLDPRLLQAETPNTPPAVYAEWKTPGAQRTLLFYAHYDGQPTDPKQWTGTLPWQPTFRTAAIEAGGQVIPNPEPGTTIDPYGMILDEIQALVAAYIFGVNKDNSIDG